MDLVDALVDVAEPDLGGEKMADGGGPDRRPPGLDLDAIELLLAHAYQRGHADGWHERDEGSRREWPLMRASIVQQAVRHMVGYLEFVGEDPVDHRETATQLRETFNLPHVTPFDAGDGNEFFQGEPGSDERLEELKQKVEDAIEQENAKREGPQPEVVAGPDWEKRQETDNPSDVIDVSFLKVEQLAAVLDGDTDAYEHANHVNVDLALAQLRSRANDPSRVGQKAAKDALDGRGLA